MLDDIKMQRIKNVLSAICNDDRPHLILIITNDDDGVPRVIKETNLDLKSQYELAMLGIDQA